MNFYDLFLTEEINSIRKKFMNKGFDKRAVDMTGQWLEDLGEKTIFFSGSNMSDAPSMNYYGGFHFQFGVGVAKIQLIFRSSNVQEAWYRSFSGGNWQPWVPLLASGMIAIQPNGKAIDLGQQGAGNANNLNISGFYSGSQILNAPNNTSMTIIHVEHRSINYATQDATMVVAPFDKFFRSKSEGVWQPWRKVTTTTV